MRVNASVRARAYRPLWWVYLSWSVSLYAIVRRDYTTLNEYNTFRIHFFLFFFWSSLFFFLLLLFAGLAHESSSSSNATHAIQHNKLNLVWRQSIVGTLSFCRLKLMRCVSTWHSGIQRYRPVVRRLHNTCHHHSHQYLLESTNWTIFGVLFCVYFIIIIFFGVGRFAAGDDKLVAMSADTALIEWSR